MNEAIKHLRPRPDKEILKSIRQKRIEKEKKIDELDAEIRELKARSAPNWEIMTVAVQKGWLEREFDKEFIHDKYASEHGEEIFNDVDECMRAKFVNEAIKHLSGYSHEDLYKKYAKKFRLASFKKELFKYTKENLEQIDHEMIYYAKKKGHILDNQYYYRIGTEIGQFIDKFYPFNDHPDSEEWQDGLPADQNDDFHPTIVKIIQDWIAKEFPNWTEDDIAEFWEAITIHMGEWR